MTCTLRRIDAGLIERLLEDPERITTFLYGDDEGAAGAFASEERAAGVAPPGAALAAEPWPAREAGDEAELDKAWHGLHFLLTGTADEGEPPACYLLHGGEEVGDVDVGYGPARVLRPAEVTQFAAFLAQWSDDALVACYDPPRMSALGIYPEVWGDDPEVDAAELDYLRAAFATLREFVGEASARGSGVVIYLS